MAKWLANSLVHIVFGFFGLSSLSQAESKIVTLSVEVAITNSSKQDINGYVQRLSMPVEYSLQQSLKKIRYDYPEKIIYKKHGVGGSKYLEFVLSIPAGRTVSRIVEFDLMLTSYDYTQLSRGRDFFPSGTYLESARFIESDSTPIKKLSLKIQNTFEDEESRLRAAFLIPQAIIKYKVQPTKGALAGLESGEGDCTEHAALFVALARSMGYPARVTSEFLFSKKKRFDRPNHHAAEVFMGGRWVPVDPNLAQKPYLGYGFGKGSISKIVLTREFSWVWSNLFPKDFKGKKNNVSVSVLWSLQ
ncbi:transglutaminase-like domain-containing protein [Microbulbifer sp. SSSA005]|uniref:transglutaminase-like domain-containing protein n=1 Tax=unclassified Microbulbifer TaxID=2619833 RepID=UPI00403A63D5